MCLYLGQVFIRTPNFIAWPHSIVPKHLGENQQCLLCVVGDTRASLLFEEPALTIFLFTRVFKHKVASNGAELQF